MSDDSAAPVADTTIPVPADTPNSISPSDAARILSAARQAKRQAAAAALPEEESAPEADAAPQEIEPSGETEAPADPEPEEAPTLDPPRSWSREQRERWSKLDPDTQQYLLERDSQDSAAVRKAQNEAAEQRKAIEAEAQAARQIRQQLEQTLEWQLQGALSGAEAQEFADIKTPDDALRLSREDPIRSMQYQAWQNSVRARVEQYQQLQTMKQQEQNQEWHSFAAKEDAAFAEQFPDAEKIRQPAIDYFRKVGFTDQEIAQNYNSPAWRDHRVQRIFRDAVLYQNAQKAKVEVVKKVSVPPVSQRPGVASGKNASREQRMNALDQQLTKSGSWKDAAKLYVERRGRP
jgi:hypothetical protein